jgi:hypothetical protein
MLTVRARVDRKYSFGECNVDSMSTCWPEVLLRWTQCWQYEHVLTGSTSSSVNPMLTVWAHVDRKYSFGECNVDSMSTCWPEVLLRRMQCWQYEHMLTGSTSSSVNPMSPEAVVYVIKMLPSTPIWFGTVTLTICLDVQKLLCRTSVTRHLVKRRPNLSEIRLKWSLTK